MERNGLPDKEFKRRRLNRSQDTLTRKADDSVAVPLAPAAETNGTTTKRKTGVVAGKRTYQNGGQEAVGGAKKPTHVRFGSEEPSIIPLPQANGSSEHLAIVNMDSNEGKGMDDDAGEGSSDDDAPEAVSVAAGLGQARAAATEVARAARMQVPPVLTSKLLSYLS